MNLAINLFLLLLNVLFFDIYNYITVEDYNPLGWHVDYLRHHATSSNILQFFEIKGIYDPSISSGPYFYAWPIPNTIYAGMIAIFGNTGGFLSTLFIFSVATFFALKLFLSLFFENKFSSTAALLSLTTSNGLIYYFISGVTVIDAVAILHRVVNPLISYPILFLFMWSYVKTLELASRRFALFAGVLFGMLFISYIYFSTYAVCFAMVLAIQMLFSPNTYDRLSMSRSKLLILVPIFFGGAMPGVWFFFENYFQVTNMGVLFENWKSRNGIIETRSLIIEKSDWIHLLLILPATIIYFVSSYLSIHGREQKSSKILFLAFFSAWAVTHSYVITGVSPQQTNYTAYLNLPLFILLFLNMIVVIFNKMKFSSLFRINSFLLAAFFIALFNSNYIFIYAKKLQNEEVNVGMTLSVPSEEFELMQWLDLEKSATIKIIAPEKLSRRIVAFSKVDTYFLDELSPVSNDTLNFRRLVVENLFDKSVQEVDLSYDRIMSALKESNVTHLVSRTNLDSNLPCETEKTFDKIKVCRLTY